MTKIAIASATKTQEKEPPKHEFLIEKQRFSDKKKDEKKTFVKLIIEPCTFSIKQHAKRIGDKARFKCNACKK